MLETIVNISFNFYQTLKSVSDFWGALLEPHPYTEMYSNTCLAYFINLLACGHQI